MMEDQKTMIIIFVGLLVIINIVLAILSIIEKRKTQKRLRLFYTNNTKLKKQLTEQEYKTQKLQKKNLEIKNLFDIQKKQLTEQIEINQSYIKRHLEKPEELYTSINNSDGVYLKPTTVKKQSFERKKNAKTNVYVMIDKNTGYFKIGRSIKPNTRERTLQSEKPTIDMLFSYPATNECETDLHSIYSKKRIRGEWFDLNGTDLKNIKAYFN